MGADAFRGVVFGGRYRRRQLLGLTSGLLATAGALVGPPWLAPLRQAAVNKLMDAARRFGVDVIRPPQLADATGVLVHNEFIGIKHDDPAKGMLILYYYDDARADWLVFNSIVPLAKAGLFENNAEMQGAAVTLIRQAEILGYQKVRYHFTPFANGAHFSLVVELRDGERKLRVQVVPEPDSKPIVELSLQSTLGFVDTISALEFAGQTYGADAWRVQDGYLVGGEWVSFRTTATRFVLRGKHLTQFQEIEAPLSVDDRLDVEVRRTPWLSNLPDPGANWFEVFRIIRRPFTPGKSAWVFGVEPTSQLR